MHLFVISAIRNYSYLCDAQNCRETHIPKAPVCQSHGLAVVVGVDADLRIVHMVATVSDYELQQTNSIVFGDYFVPDALLFDRAAKEVSEICKTLKLSWNKDDLAIY